MSRERSAEPLDAAAIIRVLGLRPLEIEGGWFTETYRSPDPSPSGADPDRPISTAILYLLTPDTFSEMHRLPGDEVFHAYLGDPVEMVTLAPDGSHEVTILGADIVAGQRVQHVVPGGTWQGARLRAGGRYALLGTTMAPGFSYAEYESGVATILVASHPAAREWIDALSRDR